VAWRRVAALAIEAGTDRRILALLAEAVFAYIDGLSALSVEGYAQEQSATAGEAERRRRRVAALLLGDEPDENAVRAAARDAGWEVPKTVAAIAWSGSGRRLRRRLPVGSLVVATGEGGGAGGEESGTGGSGRGRAGGDRIGGDDRGGRGGLALVSDPDAPGAREVLHRAAGDAIAVLGPTVPPLGTATSAHRATAVRDLVEAGVIEASGLVLADDHLAALVAHGDPVLLGTLAERWLQPLEDETPASRERLAATLRAWLDHQGEIARVAADLHVHPQTVRYRLGRLRERFGDALDDPAARFELGLALRARQTEGRM
jgi:PucR C-terminal helix-turn-helix domain